MLTLVISSSMMLVNLVKFMSEMGELANFSSSAAVSGDSSLNTQKCDVSVHFSQFTPNSITVQRGWGDPLTPTFYSRKANGLS